MNAAATADLIAEAAIITKRAHSFIWVRLLVTLLLLAAIWLDDPGGQPGPLTWLLIADIVGLGLYRLTAPRWPTASTYLSLLLAALFIFLSDYLLGQTTLVAWFGLIPLSLAGGLIVARAGFNSLITLTNVILLVLHGSLVYLGRVPVTIAMPPALFLTFGAAIGVILIILNALVETLIIYLFQAQQNMVITEVQLLQTRTELEQSRNRLFGIQNQERQRERISAIGQIADQLDKLLRQPLLASQAVLDEVAPEAAAAPAQVAGLRRLNAVALRVIDGLVQFASIGRSQIKTLNLDDILAAEIGQSPAPAGVSLHLEQPPVFPPIQADPDQMHLLLHQLLDNAYRAALRGGGNVMVKLIPAPEGVRLIVSDDGPGIPPEQLERIFDPLYTTQENGLGLGLAICQQVVRMHGGSIRVESAEGAGATFNVYLPRMPRQLPEELAQDVAG